MQRYAQPVIRVENLTHTFVVRDVKVEALRGINLTASGRVASPYIIRFRKINAYEYSRLFGPSERRSLFPSKVLTSRA